jgi:hypothetical protein
MLPRLIGIVLIVFALTGLSMLFYLWRKGRQ